MPDASTPLNEDNVAEALQAIKDARKLVEHGWLTDREWKADDAMYWCYREMQSLKRNLISYKSLLCAWMPVQRRVMDCSHSADGSRLILVFAVL